MIEIRQIKLEEEYDIFAGWWQAHGWPPVARAILPQFGYVVCEKETARRFAAGWVYMDRDAKVAMIEWAVSNPDNTPRESLKALNVLVDSITESFKRTGYLAIMTSTKTDGLIKLFEKHGFQKADTVTHLINILNPQTEA